MIHPWIKNKTIKHASGVVISVRAGEQSNTSNFCNICYPPIVIYGK